MPASAWAIGPSTAVFKGWSGLWSASYPRWLGEIALLVADARIAQQLPGFAIGADDLGAVVLQRNRRAPEFRVQRIRVRTV
jgi:hypothetical protein